MIRCLYPHHADPRDLGLYPWLEVLRDTERGFVCACCGVKQHPWRPMVFLTGLCAGRQLSERRARFYYDIARASGWVSPWCVSCAWKLCGRKMVKRRPWWRFW